MTEFIARGAISNLSSLLNTENIRKALIFTGKTSFEKHRQSLENELSKVSLDFFYYSNVFPNPDIKDVETALGILKKNFEIIIAIGGGSVIDFAKSFRYLGKYNCKLIAIPTTAGTGSEVTQFSVIYEKSEKKSLDFPCILPEYAICDSNFLKQSPRYLKACSAADTLCHAIESFWSVNSDSESMEYSKKALELCKNYILSYVDTEDNESADKMMLAANYAGHAINITRTTAAHALSYELTIKFGIPHGHAVAFYIDKVFKKNLQVNEVNCNDPRGIRYVQNILFYLQSKFFSKPNFSIQEIVDYLFKEYSFTLPDSFVPKFNKQRMKNNPVKINNSDFIK